MLFCSVVRANQSMREVSQILNRFRHHTAQTFISISCLFTPYFPSSKWVWKKNGVTPQGVLLNKEVRGLGPHIKFGCKIWGKVRPSSTNKRKNWGSSVTTRCKSLEKVLILGSYLKFKGQNLGYLSSIFLEAKSGAPTRISEAKFRAKPPDLLIWKSPPWEWPINRVLLRPQEHHKKI